MPEKTNNGKLFYDATCRFCTGSIERFRSWLAKCGVTPVPFENGAAENEMRLVWHDGRAFGGADAAIFLGKKRWLTWPLAFLAGLPGFRNLAHAIYRLIARNRHCLGGTCAIDLEKPNHRRVIGLDWALLYSFVGIALAIGFVVTIPRWLWMWMLAGALWLGFKAMAFRSAGGFRKISLLFFLWVGTDTEAFEKSQPRTKTTPIWPGLIFAALGLVLLLAVLPKIENVLALGWVGVTTMLCLFHFGSFALLAAIWNRVGFPVEPIMQAPWAAKTLGEFWGPRWNRAFSDWARIHVFRPLVRRFGVARGTLAGFFASGLAHELVISVPASGGFGLPTAYFFLQAGGVLAQRKFKRLRHRFVTLVVVLLPAPILFHPVFIERVFAPMITALLTLTNP